MIEFEVLYNVLCKTNTLKYLLILSKNNFNTILQYLDFQGIHRGRSYKLRDDIRFSDSQFSIITYPSGNTINFNSIEGLQDYLSRVEKLKVMI